jgi:hypothetical protein
MPPAVPEVKDETELIARPNLPDDLQRGMVLPHQFWLELLARKADPPAIGQLKLMQVREIPARKRLVDRLRQLLEGVTRPHDQDPTRCRVQIRPRRPQQINPDLKPRPRHARRRLTTRF